MKQWLMCAVFLALIVGMPPVAAAEPGDSQRLERAKDLIAEEQWERAIEQLKAAAADAKEKNKDEVLFWLAHSQHQAKDLAGALQTIADLQARHSVSRWLKPAQSLRVEIAQKLRRTDVLWMTAAPPAPPAPPRPGAEPPLPPPPPATPRAAAPAAPPAPRPAHAPPARPARGAKPSVIVTPASPPPTVWATIAPDTNLRIQALGSLIATDASRVIPMLREIALESTSPREASRAIFVLAQSGNPEAHSTVLEVARVGSEPVRIAAVKELGRFGGPSISDELLKVYSISSEPVKYQVVNALGERAETNALLHIARTESNRRLQERAIVRLGQAGGRDQLRRFYDTARPELKSSIINGLFNARDEDELIRIAQQEKNTGIRNDVLLKLRILGTDKARAYLESQKKK